MKLRKAACSFAIAFMAVWGVGSLGALRAQENEFETGEGAEPRAGCITFGDAACLPDDPVGLMRAGDGRFARGSAGPTGQGRGKVITVTSAKGDASTGTIRWAYLQIDQPAKVLFSSALDGKKIVFPAGFLMKWDKPYTTLDCSNSSVRFQSANDQPFSQVIALGATHDVIFKGCAGIGHFDEDDPQLPANNMTIFGITNFIGVKYPWDDEWNSTPPQLRGTARNILFDQIGCSNAQDDCVSLFDGVSDTSILRSFVRRGWHPSTAGSQLFRPVNDPKERRRVTYAYNVWYRNGARQIRAWRGIRDWRFVRNILASWVEYVSPNGPITPNGGLWFEDDTAGENDLGYIVGNLGLPGVDNPNMAAFVGDDWRCEANGQLPPGSPYADCNPKMAATRWFFDRNEWDAPDAHTNPPGYDGSMNRGPGDPSEPILDEARPWTLVLAQAGPPKRTAAENADKAAIAADLP